MLLMKEGQSLSLQVLCMIPDISQVHNESKRRHTFCRETLGEKSVRLRRLGLAQIPYRRCKHDRTLGRCNIE